MHPPPCTGFSLAEYTCSWPPHRAFTQAEMERQSTLLQVAWQNTLGFDTLLAKPLRFAPLFLPPAFKQQWSYLSTPPGLAVIAAGRSVYSSKGCLKVRIRGKSLVSAWKRKVLDYVPRNCFFKDLGVTNLWVMRPGTEHGHGGRVLELTPWSCLRQQLCIGVRQDRLPGIHGINEQFSSPQVSLDDPIKYLLCRQWAVLELGCGWRGWRPV